MIITKTPFRVSFGGGGTDISDFYQIEQGAVLSVTINKYMYIVLNHRFDDGFRLAYSQVEEVSKVTEIIHPLIRECIKSIPIESADIVSVADIPQATGLGSSSSFTVGLLNALAAYCSKYLSKDSLAREACKIEIEKLKGNIGKQDQYAAAYGGLNLIEFNTDNTVEVRPILCETEIKDELNQSLMLFYLGKRIDDAGDIISTYDFKGRWQALRDMRDLAYEMKDVLEEGKILSDFGLLLDESWKLKKSLSNKVSHPDIDLAYDTAQKAGAIGGKVCGAGNRGFLLLFCE